MRKLQTFAAAAACVVTGTIGARAETLIVTSALSPTHFVALEGIDPLMSCITERTGGDIEFNYFPSEQLADRKSTIDALNKGIAQIGYVSNATEASKLPLSGVTMLPSLADSATETVHAWRAAVEQGGPLADEFTKNKLRPLVLIGLGAYQVMTIGKVSGPEDVKGLKLRAPGGFLTLAAEAIGGVPVEMTGGDMYVALQRGAVDGALSNLASANSYKLQELLKYVSHNGNFGTATLNFAISTDAYDRLSESHKAAVDACGLEVEAHLAAYVDGEVGRLYKDFEAAGVTVFDFTDEQLATFREMQKPLAEEYIERLKKRGLPGQEAYDSFVAALQD